MIRGWPSTSWQSFARARKLSLVRAVSTVRSKVRIAFPLTSRRQRSRIPAAFRRAYQTSRLRIAANSRIASRYERTVLRTAARICFGVNSRSRPAISKLAASRLTSHSHGPGRVSSKSLTSITRRRSGAAKTPKFDRCASPQSWTRKPAEAVPARSAAMMAAPPRKNANSDATMRPCRIGINSGMRVLAWSFSTVTGSGRSFGGSQVAWLERGTSARAAFPLAARSSGVKRGRSRTLLAMLNPTCCRPRLSPSILAARPSPDLDDAASGWRGCRGFNIAGRRATSPFEDELRRCQAGFRPAGGRCCYRRGP
jgi:hypothetical protein